MDMRTTTLIASIAGALTILGAARPADATTYVAAGGYSCHGYSTGQGGYRDGAFVNLLTNASMLAQCALAPGTLTSYPQPVAAVVVRYIDNNSSTAFSCRPGQLLIDGSVHYALPKYTCLTAGGCSSGSQNSFTGNGYLMWTEAELTPYQLDDLYLDGSFFVECTVPRQVNNATSGIISYYTVF
jgi:hypothetical protein